MYPSFIHLCIFLKERCPNALSCVCFLTKVQKILIFPYDFPYDSLNANSLVKTCNIWHIFGHYQDAPQIFSYRIWKNYMGFYKCPETVKNKRIIHEFVFNMKVQKKVLKTIYLESVLKMYWKRDAWVRKYKIYLYIFPSIG